jgi:hypothetical protein
MKSLMRARQAERTPQDGFERVWAQFEARDFEF